MIKAIADNSNLVVAKAQSAMCDYCDRRRMCKSFAFGETLRKFICNACCKVLETGSKK